MMNKIPQSSQKLINKYKKNCINKINENNLYIKYN